MLHFLLIDVEKQSNPKKAKILSSFFKTGPGQYGEGDQFLGLTVPVCRQIAHRYLDLSEKDLKQLFISPYHEHRLIGFLILVSRFLNTTSPVERKKIYLLYKKYMKWVNNWDLVDLTADKIIGAYLEDKSKQELYQWAHSKNLWVRRIAIVSTFYFIRKRQFKDTLEIAKILLNDKHDLIHKAVGWMLREVGKKDQDCLCEFLDEYARKMPRTALRYAIERFDTKLRLHYLNLPSTCFKQ